MKNLRAMRLARHLSQQKLAEQFGLSQQSIYKYENNLSEPDIQTLKDFADFFHTTIDTLVDYEPETQTPNMSTLTPEELHILHLYRNLSTDVKPHILGILEAFHSN